MTSDYTLTRGAHDNPLDGRRAMEWVSHLAGEPHRDAPARVSPVVRVLCTALSDALDDNARQRLRPYLPRTVETVEEGLDEARSWMAMDWLVRVFAPTWLAAIRLRSSADAVAALPPIAEVVALNEAIRALERARVESRDAWSASLGAARVMGWVPRTAGRGIAREAAWRSFGRPAWAAAAVAIRRRACDRASAICPELPIGPIAISRRSIERAEAADGLRRRPPRRHRANSRCA